MQREFSRCLNLFWLSCLFDSKQFALHERHFERIVNDGDTFTLNVEPL